jgi:hypothetical protein
MSSQIARFISESNRPRRATKHSVFTVCGATAP